MKKLVPLLIIFLLFAYSCEKNITDKRECTCTCESPSLDVEVFKEPEYEDYARSRCQFYYDTTYAQFNWDTCYVSF